MLKINVYNMQKFMELVNNCEGPVNLITADGRYEDLRKNTYLQEVLSSIHENYTARMPLNLSVTVTKDYMNLVYFTMGDC